MAAQAGSFVWYELMTSDPTGAEAFYEDVVGWSANESGMPGPAYTILSAGETMVGGLMAIPEHAAGARPGWLGYVAVEDVDASAKQVTEHGGTVHRGPADIPDVGRFAVAADPQGAVFVLFKGSSARPAQRPPSTPGLIGWRELHTSDSAAGFAFYASLLGWRKAEAVDMGPMGIYQMFATGDATAGGMWTETTAAPPHWLYYINVDAIHPAAERVKQSGGQIIHGPMQVPGGSWIVQGLDPQGAKFALVQLAA